MRALREGSGSLRGGGRFFSTQLSPQPPPRAFRVPLRFLGPAGKETNGELSIFSPKTAFGAGGDTALGHEVALGAPGSQQGDNSHPNVPLSISRCHHNTATP